MAAKVCTHTHTHTHTRAHAHAHTHTHTREILFYSVCIILCKNIFRNIFFKSLSNIKDVKQMKIINYLKNEY